MLCVGPSRVVACFCVLEEEKEARRLMARASLSFFLFSGERLRLFIYFCVGLSRVVACFWV